jgi:5-methylcytosine-specific restriction endonuclease McrA
MKKKRTSWSRPGLTDAQAQARWKKIRARVLARDHHLCKAKLWCCTIKAEEVHHVYARFRDRSRVDDRLRNLMSVCKNCHEILTTNDVVAEREMKKWLAHVEKMKFSDAPGILKKGEQYDGRHAEG